MIDEVLRQEFLKRYANFVREVALPDVLSLRVEKESHADANEVVRESCALYAFVNSRYTGLVKSVDVLCSDENNTPADINDRKANVAVTVRFTDGIQYVLDGGIDSYGADVKIRRVARVGCPETGSASQLAQEPHEFPRRSGSDHERLIGDLAEVMRRHSVENDSNTPDFIVAEYLVRCLDAFATASRRREQWRKH